MPGTLYLVGTPIGNLGDFSPRGVKTLEEADFIAAEDTRVTLKLLNHFEIKKPLVSYHRHSPPGRLEQIVQRLEEGECCALCSDAGMPCISDPGEDLVRTCRSRHIPVVAVPGPSAVINALALSGLPTGRFAFEGFLSAGKKERKAHLASLSSEERTMVFYEAPHKLSATLEDLYQALGDRPVALCREMTKLHEEVIRITLSQGAAYCKEHPPRGEFVLVVEGAAPVAQPDSYTLEEALALVVDYRQEGMPLSQAARQAAKETGFQKGMLYRAAVQVESEEAVEP